ncbi:MAG: hypothetical protein SFY67_18430 [Candidatus Melainabacteria bacterium]|nr:hypothetical protein [Candidatus Melainabacteria bacterium]
MQIERRLPRIAVQGLTGCAGELLVILENLGSVLPFVQVASFPFAQSKNDLSDIDIAFVEGSVSQKHDIDLIKEIRTRSKWLVAVGNCAVHGCVQSSTCSRYKTKELVEAVYAKDSPIEALDAKPLSSYVDVDVELSGCPIDKNQFLAVLASLLKDHLPYIIDRPVCLECKMRENGCVLIEKNLPCLGPVTAAGCGALCPSFEAACYGCFGPCKDPQLNAMATVLSEKGYNLSDILVRLGTFGIPEQLLSNLDVKR